PENVIVDDEQDPAGVMLLGLGIYPLVYESRLRANTRVSGMLGYAYQAPELLSGSAPTQSTDLYALGALIHHMVSGRPPEGFETAEAYHDAPQLLDVVRRAMSRDPKRRYDNASNMRAALDWVEVESERMNAHTQDIPLWMEHSMVGNIPVPELLRARSPSSAPPPPMPGASRQSSPPSPRPRGESTSRMMLQDLSDPSIRIEYLDDEPTSQTRRPPPMWAQAALAAAMVVAVGVLAWVLTG
ncbi:MAG: hypothetical protein H5U40_05025, partial [Polyangiaceae bacterium]|nr:hypothetical protein [Polyangiaceae bacterium]